MGNTSSSEAAAAASNESNSTFNEAMCQRFNAFYDVDPLPEGRVRPKFEGSEPHLALVAHSNYESIKQFRGIKQLIITPEVQDKFIKLFAQFEPFPTPLAGCLTDNTNLKMLKQNDSVEFNKAQTYDAKHTADFKLKFNLIMCKLKFLGFIVEYVTKPVVLEWDKYMKEKQGQQTLSPEDETQLSTLLQIKLLEGMVDMIEKTKGNVAVNAYVPTAEENKNYETLKNKPKQIALQREREQQQPQGNLNQQPQGNRNQQQDEETREKIEADLYPLGGGSKYKRQSKRRKQRNQQKRRQKSKKYCK